MWGVGCELLCPLAAECVNCLAELKGMSLPRKTVKVKADPFGVSRIQFSFKGNSMNNWVDYAWIMQIEGCAGVKDCLSQLFI